MAEPHLDFMKGCADLAGAALGEGAFSAGPAIWVGKREVANFDGPLHVDVRLTRGVIRARRPELRTDERVELRPDTSDWIRVRVASPSDIDRGLELVRDAVAANVPTAKHGPPPSGAELAHRRRFP